MKFFKTILFIVTLLVALSTQFVIHAGMSPLAFKNAGKCFKPGYEFYNQIFGSAGLTSGVIQDLRFFNVDAFIDKDGKRDYIKDKAPKDDHVMEIVKILLPSPAGELTTETAAVSSFGKLCTTKAQVAALPNFVHAVRKFLKNHKNKLPDKITGILSVTKQNEPLERAFPMAQFKNTEKNKLLTEIAKAVEQEERPSGKATTPVFYPRYIVEQIINAFFCYKFADQKDIKAFLQELDDDIVDKTKITAIDGNFVEEDVAKAITNISLGNAIDFDDIWIICNRDIFSRLLPYPQGNEPISNGSAQLYQRSSNNLSASNVTFPDCVEVALRHVINFILYDPVRYTFKIPAGLDTDDQRIKNLYDFYDLQSPDKANAGDKVIRSAWNKVVADLGNGIVYGRKFGDSDPGNNNEIKSGMVNIMRVLKTLFSLDLGDEPVYEPGKESEFKSSAQKWISDGLTKLFTFLNGDYTYEVECSNIALASARQDLVGDINVVVSNSLHEKLFSFSIHVKAGQGTSGHVAIQNLNITQKDRIELGQDVIKNIHNNIITSGYQKTIFPSLLLLDTTLQSAETLALTSPLYLMFRETITDSTSMINALKMMHSLLAKSLISRDHAARILENILRNFLWDDKQIVSNAMEIIIKLKELASDTSDRFTQVLKEGVKGLALKSGDDIKLVDFYSHVENIFSASPCMVETLSIPALPKLKRLIFTSEWLKTITFSDKMANLEEIELLFVPIITSIDITGCSHLKKFTLSHTEILKELIFPKTMESLDVNLEKVSVITNLDLSSSANLKSFIVSSAKNLNKITIPERIQRLEIEDVNITNLDLSSCSNLKELKLADTPKLTSITFPEKMEHLEKIDIVGPSIQNLSNLDFSSCFKLKELELAEISQLGVITFPEKMENLEVIHIENATNTNLDLSSCFNLKWLTLVNTSQLMAIIFPAKMAHLEKIDIYQTAIESLDVSSCFNVKELLLPSLGAITFPQVMESLQALDLRSSAITLLDLSTCLNLKSLKLAYTNSLETIMFPEVLRKLEILDFESSAITSLRLPSCPLLQEINLSETENLMTVKFMGPMPELKKMNVKYSAVEEISGVHFCPQLNKKKIDKAIEISD